MLRKIIKIDEKKCDGCGDCTTGCAEGAIKVIDGKARLVKESYCDGLGACIAFCPQGAIQVIDREADEYSEADTLEYLFSEGEEEVKKHLIHLIENNQIEMLSSALAYLSQREHLNFDISGLFKEKKAHKETPGRKSMGVSQLSQWPIQFHLVSPAAPFLRDSSLVLAADCVGFSYVNFHDDFLKDKKLIIACPKLDSNKEMYIQKLADILSNCNLTKLTVMIMQVPCCGGLSFIAKKASEIAQTSVPIEAVVIGFGGEILDRYEIK